MLKKKTSKNKKTELIELDSAVSELSKQTEALLSSFGSEHPQEEASTDKKPTLPKKQTVAHAKIKHFDIIHDPKTKKKLQGTLKTAPKRDHSDQDELLIPASTQTGHDKSQKDTTVTESAASGAVVVQAHKEGLLSQARSEDTKTDNVAEAGGADISSIPAATNAGKAISFAEPEPAAAKTADDHLDKNVLPDTKSTPEEDKAVEDKPEEDAAQKNDELAAKTVPEKLDDSEASDVADEDAVVDPGKKDEAKISDEKSATEASTTDSTEGSKEEQTSYRGELYANNLIKEAQPKGFEAQADGKPMLYDTEEYHPELHDWSTLQHNSGTSWLVLVLVLVVAGAIAYFVLTDQSLPFEINL